jgi:hypothetical protein
MFDAPQANQLATLFTIGAIPPMANSATPSTSSIEHATSSSETSTASLGSNTGHHWSPSTLPPSAYGGIGAGAAVVVLLMVGAGVLLCRRKRKEVPKTLNSPYNQRSSPGSEAGLRDYEEKQTIHRMTLSGLSQETSPVELSSMGSQRRTEPYRTAEAVYVSRLRHELPAENEVRPAPAVPPGPGPEIPASLRAPTRPVTQGV